MNKPQFISIEGAELGRCNICGCFCKLTYDHVPPQGAMPPSSTVIGHIADRLRVQPSLRPRISQNGMKFRTLCDHCNNVVLGKQYDPALIDFIAQVSSNLSSCKNRWRRIRVQARPQRLARAVLGHLTASGVDRYQDDDQYAEIRDCLLDPTHSLPSGFTLYYWLYPYSQMVIIRDAVMGELRPQAAYTFWLLKFYPMAFMVAWDGPNLSRPGLRSFSNWRDISVDERTEIVIDSRPLPSSYFPEAPTDDRFLLMGECAYFCGRRAKS